MSGSGSAARARTSSPDGSISCWPPVGSRAAWCNEALPDTVGPDMLVLLVGLNPSLHAADKGYAFAGPGNRFWPAALEAGLVTAAHDSHRALLVDRVGMTDLVKRPTGTAGDLASSEYRDGLRIEWLCEWLAPAAVCFVGLTGYRAVRDARATAGWQDRRLGGSPVYVMPSERPERPDHPVRTGRSLRSGASCSVDADRAGHARPTQTAVAPRVLRQVLLVVVLGVVEGARIEDLGRDRPVACRRAAPGTGPATPWRRLCSSLRT